MISVAITAYNESQRGRFRWIRECLAAPIDHQFVREIVVVDDASPDFFSLVVNVGNLPKVRLLTNPENLGVFGNKIESVAQASGDWVLMVDSDNVFGPDALDRLALLALDERALYSPAFGRPALDYRHMVGRWQLADFERLRSQPAFGCLVNTGNQLVHRASFLDVLRPFAGPRFDLQLPDYFGAGDRSDLRWRRIYDSADSFFINKQWWLAGGAIEVVDGLEYVHGSLTPEHQAEAPSSWERAPREKEALPPIFERELAEAARRAA